MSVEVRQCLRAQCRITSEQGLKKTLQVDGVGDSLPHSVGTTAHPRPRVGCGHGVSLSLLGGRRVIGGTWISWRLGLKTPG